jgi:hypothetical protein
MAYPFSYKNKRGEINVRHDSVSRALYRCALMMGLPARLEPTGLDPNSDLRPDLLLSLPGRQILTDVAVVHPLAPGKVRAKKSHPVLGSARQEEGAKRRKYANLVASRHYQSLPFIMETCGGMGAAAERLIDILSETGEAHLRVWAQEDVVRELLHSVAIAVQRGGALSYLHGYEQALLKIRTASEARGEKTEASQLEDERLDSSMITDEESEEESAPAA